MNPKLVMVTGASGRVGKLLVTALSQGGHKVLAISRKNNFTKLKNVTFLDSRETIFNPKDVYGLSHLFHLESQTSAYVARWNPYADLHFNVGRTLKLVEILNSLGAKPTFIFPSSMTLYGSPGKTKVDESFEIKLSTFYDIQKFTNERYLFQLTNEGMLEASIILRISNVYGCDPDHEQNSERGFIDKSIWMGIHNKPLAYYGTGTYFRDYLHINDVVTALIKIVDLPSSEYGRTEVYNLGTGNGTPLVSALNIIAEECKLLTNREVLVTSSATPIGLYENEFRSYITNFDKFKNKFGWEPYIDLRTGIKKSAEAQLIYRSELRDDKNE